MSQTQVQEFAGIYDRTQMQQTLQQWQQVPANHDLLPIFDQVTQHLTGKNSTPYCPTSPHNFMHNKLVVCDDVVVTGSFNFSHSAAQNAENHLAIHDPNLADQYSQYIDSLIQHYH